MHAGAPAPQINPNNNAFVPQLVEQDKTAASIRKVTKIMRQSLPPKAKISTNSKEMIQKCVSKFKNIITSKANEHCLREYRKVVKAEDILWAMKSLGFDNYDKAFTHYLKNYRDNGLGPGPGPKEPPVEIPKPILTSPHVETFVGLNTPTNPNPIIETFDAVDMDEACANLGDLDVGSLDNAASTSFDVSNFFNFDGFVDNAESTSFDVSTYFNFDGFDERYDN
ncbi:nuclear transcription factor Y subunit B-4 [Trifolium repens]|nr:nuclear transcription factor Y subunit B-4 [Trifolium repens]